MSGEARHLTLNPHKRHWTVRALDKLNDCISDAVCLFEKCRFSLGAPMRIKRLAQQCAYPFVVSPVPNLMVKLFILSRFPRRIVARSRATLADNAY